MAAFIAMRLLGFMFVKVWLRLEVAEFSLAMVKADAVRKRKLKKEMKQAKAKDQ